jgi:hypothetical protein
MASYAEDVARWRMERKQAQIADRVSQIGAEYAQAVRERDRAIGDGDTETAEYRDMDCEQLEGEYREYVPPQQTMHPAAQQWLLQNKPFFDRHGAKADEAVRAAHAWLTRQGSAGVKVNSPEYFKAVEDLLEMHGPTYYGVRYDAGEKQLTANEAVKISLGDNGQRSTKIYNDAARQAYAQGKIGTGNR